MAAGRPQAGNHGEEGNQDDDGSGDKGGTGRGGEAEAGGLELIAHGEAKADNRSGEERFSVHAAEVTAVKGGEAGEGQGHTDEVEEER